MALTDRRFLTIAVVAGVAAALSLSACGRRGPLEAPPSATAVTNTAAGAPVDESGPTKPQKPFILDPLLD